MRIYTGCIYSEWTGNGKHGGHKELTIVGEAGKKFRWVAEVCYRRKRYRFRSSSFSNCQAWRKEMCRKFNTIL